MIVSYSQRLKDLQKLSLLANLTNENELIVSLPNNCITKFEDVIGKLLPIGTVVTYNNIKYLVMQSVTPIETQPPNATGMLAIYKPYRDSDEYPWLYGEYVEIGWIRNVVNENDKIVRYRAIQDPNANIYSPEIVPNIWEVVEDSISE